MDIRTDNPVGRVPDLRSTRRARLDVQDAGWRLGRRHGRWTADDVQTLLRQLDTTHALHCTGQVRPADAGRFATFLHRAVARGTFVSAALDAPAAGALPADLAERIAPTPHAGEVGELDWDVAAVAQRRAALAPLVGVLPPLSAVLLSRRADLVLPMVRRLAAQTYPDLEIVVATHGVPLPEGLRDAAADRPVVARELPGTLVFGDALNAAFALASGTLVMKVDDDDHIGDLHLWDLAAAHAYSGATLVGKTTTVVHLAALDTTVRRVFGTRESFTNRVAGSTMTMAREDLAAVGGWQPVPRAVDTALLASVRDAGGTVYQPHDIGYLYVRGHDPGAHTWTAGVEHFLRNVREQWIGLLAHPAFGTGRDGAASA